MQEELKVGLALGSGAFRGLSQIGILEVFEENHIPIHMVSGCSIGAVVGSIYCAGADLKYVKGLACTLDVKQLADVTLPREGLIKGEKIETLIAMLTKHQNFEDLKIPLSVVACDLLNAEVKTFNTGKVHRAVRASLSIPGVFMPVKMDGTMYVDGGVMDRVPIKAVRDMGAEFIIAVDVGFRGAPKSVNGIVETLIVSMGIMEWQLVRNRILDADVAMMPELNDINPYTLTQAEECIERGRKLALAMLPEIQEKLEKAREEKRERQRMTGPEM